uniref:Uncharacterized protein n=1 Tax=Helianthus annuus TaxID=4232 RepID=A0A251URL3_HELAN
MSYWRTLCESSSEPMYKYNLEKMYNRLVVSMITSTKTGSKTIKKCSFMRGPISVATLVSAPPTELRASTQI